MKRLPLLLLPLLLLLALAPVSMADTLDDIKERGVLRVGMEPGYMPFELTNQKGEIIGFDPDVAKRMAKKLGVKLELVSTAWDGIIPSLMTGKFDIIMSGMTITDERAEVVDFANPYIIIGQTVLLRKDLAGEVTSYKTLNDPKYKIASKLGTTGEFAAKETFPDAQYFSYETEQEAVMEVVSGKIDAFIYDSPYNAVAFAEKGQGKLVFLDEPFTEERIGWAVRKGNPKMLEFLNAFLAEIKTDGTYDKIYTKWFKDDTWLKELQ
ncbi:MAG: transporter substrate-binding domain-containing protein [Desulfuromonadales bacterium]|uniref:transporter substrate-binding domain-containing protein n=1 Tax=Desulfuromonas sp. KJ2020 TaxID=2919173 RepID=UPI0020A7EDAB|nr:transporter substrate-binding domain-containing protein [Desulfuromonas sp. KJ2020]MCP3175682.1 transporter substrate-binding domain-containing protein [Desulfuromonas sp. KJ2020]